MSNLKNSQVYKLYPHKLMKVLHWTCSGGDIWPDDIFIVPTVYLYAIARHENKLNQRDRSFRIGSLQQSVIKGAQGR